MERLKLAYDLYNNSIYLNHLDKIENKETLEICKKINNRKKIYFYILDLIKDIDTAYSKRLKMKIYQNLGKEYYQKQLTSIKDYIECIVDEDIIAKQEREWIQGNIISFNEAKKMYTSFLYYELSLLEYKLKEYKKSLEYINAAIELTYLTNALIEQKYKILNKIDKQKAKNYLKQLEIEYKDKKIENLNGTTREKYEYLRLMHIKSTISELLKKCQI